MRLAHVGWNLAGLSLPLGVAAITVPDLLARIGDERFGLLALAWGLIGYAGALDLGLGRAVTQMVASLRGERRFETIPDILATASRVTLIVGVLSGALIILFAVFGGYSLIKAEQTPAEDIFWAVVLLAIALPLQAMSATYRGLNEAYLNFKGINLLRSFLGAVNFGGPYLISTFTSSLVWLIGSLVLSRSLALVAYRWLAIDCLENSNLQTRRGTYSYTIFKKLFSFGGWVTVSCVISPILVQADRFVIATFISAAAVSIYVLPYEVVVQSLIIVGSISSVIFPHLSQLIKEKPGKWQLYFRKWLLLVVVIMGVVCTTLASTLPLILPLWIKVGFVAESVIIGQVLCIGVFANSIGSMFNALIHAQGKANLTAIIQLLELPIFIALLAYLVSEYGLIGGACAWSFRMIFDAVLLWLFSRKCSNQYC